jgi:hypothetical protein
MTAPTPEPVTARFAERGITAARIGRVDASRVTRVRGATGDDAVRTHADDVAEAWEGGQPACERDVVRARDRIEVDDRASPSAASPPPGLGASMRAG